MLPVASRIIGPASYASGTNWGPAPTAPLRSGWRRNSQPESWNLPWRFLPGIASALNMLLVVVCRGAVDMKPDQGILLLKFLHSLGEKAHTLVFPTADGDFHGERRFLTEFSHAMGDTVKKRVPRPDDFGTKFGAGDRTRTGTLSPAVDFELFAPHGIQTNSVPCGGR